MLDRTALILDIFGATPAARRRGAGRIGPIRIPPAALDPRLDASCAPSRRAAPAARRRRRRTRPRRNTKLEADRREIGRRIALLKRQLADIQQQRSQHRRQRRESAIPVLALVGYTNAGKSTLLNKLTKAGVRAEDQLFATLDPTTRRTELPSGHAVLLTDTVGFIQKLPTELVAAFRATLEEVTQADVLVHVVDASHPNVDEQVAAVEEVLEELDAGDKPVITALNKIDRLDRNDPAVQARLLAGLQDYPSAVAISAQTGAGLSDLLERIDAVLYRQMAPVDVLIPTSAATWSPSPIPTASWKTRITSPRASICTRLPVQLAGRYADYWYTSDQEPPLLQRPRPIRAKDLRRVLRSRRCVA